MRKLDKYLHNGGTIGEMDHYKLVNDGYLDSHIAVAYQEESDFITENLRDGFAIQFKTADGKKLNANIHGILTPYTRRADHQIVHPFTYVLRRT